jgi:tRNA U34 2-thiouridine synthase MnmA/TrmU
MFDVLLIQGREHPALYWTQIATTHMRWTNPAAAMDALSCAGGALRRVVRTRHLQELTPCTIRLLDLSELRPDSPHKVTKATYHYRAVGYVPWLASGQVATLPSIVTKQHCAPSASQMHLLVTPDYPIRGIAPGQEIVVYSLDGRVCEGGAHILDGLGNWHHTSGDSALPPGLRTVE